jgi:hypothetical protein
MMRTRPVPTDASRSRTKLRSGSPRPRISTTAMMIRNAALSDQPGLLTYLVVSDSPMPITSAPRKASGNDAKLPTSAAAMAGTTSRASWFGSRNVMGAIRTPARPARPAPIIQLTTAIVSGEWPSAAVARWFSATAEVSRPKGEKR